MKFLFVLMLSLFSFSSMANVWTYQVNINGTNGPVKKMDSGKNSFDAGSYYCEVTPVSESNGTQYRTLVCSVGTGTVSTGGLCTKKGAKFPSVQYAILNLNGPKTIVNVVVACKFN